jgi:antitoxin component YwqK of YwqJK toxin-antitoxin module
VKFKYQQIIDVFTNLDELKDKGIWFNGIEVEGEYKKWHSNGQLFINCNYNDKMELKGEYKMWNSDGQLLIHSFYRGINSNYYSIIYQGEDDKRFKGVYKLWDESGKLEKHIIFNNDGTVKEKII